MRRWKGLTLCFEALEMKFDSLLYELQYFLFAFSRSDAAREIRNIGAPAFGPFFNYNHIFHLRYLLLETRLFQYIVRRTWRYLNAGFTGDCDRSGLGRMSELTMTTFHSYLHPSVNFNPPYQFFDLHRSRMSRMAPAA